MVIPAALQVIRMLVFVVPLISHSLEHTCAHGLADQKVALGVMPPMITLIHWRICKISPKAASLLGDTIVLFRMSSAVTCAELRIDDPKPSNVGLPPATKAGDRNGDCHVWIVPDLSKVRDQIEHVRLILVGTFDPAPVVPALVPSKPNDFRAIRGQ